MRSRNSARSPSLSEVPVSASWKFTVLHMHDAEQLIGFGILRIPRSPLEVRHTARASWTSIRRLPASNSLRAAGGIWAMRAFNDPAGPSGGTDFASGSLSSFSVICSKSPFDVLMSIVAE